MNRLILRTHSTVIRIIFLMFAILWWLPIAGFGQPHGVENAYSLYSERGYLTSSSFSTDGEEIINNFNGNLMYRRPLSQIPTSAAGISQELALTYNGSVGHVVSGGEGQGDHRETSFSMPEWILSLNGYAVQTFNFENEFVSWRSQTDDNNQSVWDDEISHSSDVARVITGYHYNKTVSLGSKMTFTMLLGDGSLQTFVEDAIGGPIGRFYTLSSQDKSKAYLYGLGDSLKVFNPDGTVVVFSPYNPTFKTPFPDENSVVMLLPIRFGDRFGNSVAVEYYYKFADSTLIYGRPLVKRAGHYTFDWGNLLNKGFENELVISNDIEGEIYTIGFGDYEAWLAANLTNENTTGLVSSITDKLGRSESFGYLWHTLKGTNVLEASYQYSFVNGNWMYTAPNFLIKPHRLYYRQNTNGGGTRYHYIDDATGTEISYMEWDAWPCNGFSGSCLNYPATWDTLVVDYDINTDCVYGSTPIVPCYRSPLFEDYGRDPFFVNMVTGKVRYGIEQGDTAIVSRDSLEFPWEDVTIVNPNLASIEEGDNLATVWYSDSVMVYDDPEFDFAPDRKDSILFKQYKEWIGYALETRDRDRVIREVHSSTNLLDDYEFIPSWDLLAARQQFWQTDSVHGRFLLDSVKSYRDGAWNTSTFDYEFVSAPNLPLNADTMVNMLKRMQVDPMNLQTATFFNDNYFDIEDTTTFYSTMLIDSQVTIRENDTLLRQHNAFYSATDNEGYAGQVSEESSYIFEEDSLVGSTYRQYTYLKDAPRQMDNGALFEVLEPHGRRTVFEYPPLLDTTVTASVHGADAIDTAIAIVALDGTIHFSLIIAGSVDHPQTRAKVLLNWSVVENLSSCNDCEKVGIFSVNSGDTVTLMSETGGTEDSECQVQATANIYIGGSQESIYYYTIRQGGTVDSVEQAFDAAGPFWYKLTVYDSLSQDSLVTYQLVDSLGMPRLSIDGNRVGATYHYDDIHRIERIVLPYGFLDGGASPDSIFSIAYVYDDEISTDPVSGYRYTRSSAGRGHYAARMVVDSHGRIIEQVSLDSTGAILATTKTEFDYVDRIINTVDPLSYKTSYLHDALNRTLRITYPAPISISSTAEFTSSTFAAALPDYPFDTSGLDQSLTVTKAYDENGNRTEVFFDAKNQRRANKQYLTADSALITYFDYDRLGRLSAFQRPAGDQAHYRHNSLGWLLREWSADQDTTYYRRDSLGNVVAQRNGVVSLTEIVVADTIDARAIGLGPLNVVDTHYMTVSDTVYYYLEIEASAPWPNTFARVRVDNSTILTLEDCTGSCDTSGWFIVDSGQIVTVEGNVDTREQSFTLAEAEAYFDTREFLRKHVFHEHDGLNRVTAVGSVSHQSADSTDPGWNIDSSSVDYERRFYYDMHNVAFSQGRLSLSQALGYDYAERWNYDGRGRVTERANFFNATVLPVVDDSVFIRTEDTVGTVRDTLLITSAGYARYHLYRYWTFDSLSWVKIFKNSTAVEISAYPPAILETIDDSVYCESGDTVIVELRIGTAHPSIVLEGTAWHPPAANPDHYVTGDSLKLQYTYNLADQVTSITYPDGMVVVYDYDSRGRLSAVGDTIDQYKYARLTYTDRDQIDTLILGDSLQIVNYVYNERGWLTSINDGVSYDDTTGLDLFGQKLFYYTDSLNGTPQYNGNIAATRSSTGGDWIVPVTYEYDSLSRVTASRVAGSTLLESMSYDENGNFDTTYNFYGGGTLHYHLEAGANRLDSVIGRRDTRFAWDADGNMILDSAKGAIFRYDVFGQMDTVTFAAIPGGIPYLAHGYNAGGERVYKRYYYWYKDRCGIGTFGAGPGDGGGGTIDSCWFADSTATYYIIGMGKTLAEYDTPGLPGSPKAKYVFAGDQRIAMIDGSGQVHFYLNDHLGSTRAIFTNVNDAVVLEDKYIYHTFGGEWNTQTNTNQVYTYTGKPIDTDGGIDLHYYGARFYDSEIGRFMTVDSRQRLYSAWSPYAYALDNPVFYIDVDGDQATPYRQYYNTRRAFRTIQDDYITPASEAVDTYGPVGTIAVGVLVIATPAIPDEYPVIGALAWIATRTVIVIDFVQAVEQGYFVANNMNMKNLTLYAQQLAFTFGPLKAAKWIRRMQFAGKLTDAQAAALIAEIDVFGEVGQSLKEEYEKAGERETSKDESDDETNDDEKSEPTEPIPTDDDDEEQLDPQ